MGRWEPPTWLVVLWALPVLETLFQRMLRRAVWHYVASLGVGRGPWGE